MGMPEIVVSFSDAAKTIIKRSARGVVAMILKDASEGADITKINRAQDIGSSFTAANAIHIKRCLDSGARTVIAVRAKETIAETLALLKSQIWNWLVYPEAETADTAAIVAWIKEQRAAGATRKAVVAAGAAPNSEGIVNFATTGIKDATGAITSGAYCAKLAGILAGTPLDHSATYYEDKEVTEITESADLDAETDAGKLVLFYAREKFRLSRAVTSLTSANGVPADFKNIKHVEGCDMISDDIRNIFEDEYVGQVANSYDNKQLLVARINDYLKKLEGSVLDPEYENLCEIDMATQRLYIEETGTDTSSMEDILVLKANTDSAVFLKMNVRLLSATEDMTLNVILN